MIRTSSLSGQTSLTTGVIYQKDAAAESHFLARERRASPSPDPTADAAWAAEVKRRIESIDGVKSS